MKLSEQFGKTLLDFPYTDSEDGQCIGSGCMTHYSSLKCAEIAEQFAIDFVKWWSENNEKEGTIMEILEIYKNTL